MKPLGALAMIFAIIFGLLAVAELDALQTSLAGSISGPLANLVSNFGFILFLLVAMIVVGGVVAAFRAFTR